MKEPFERAVARHGPTVLRVCRAVLGTGADSDDAWSEAFLAAMTAWPELPADVNVEAWLVRVAHRKAIDIIRSRGRHAVPTADVPERAADTGDPGCEHTDIWDIVARLPERQRLAVAYHYFGGLPHRQTAELIGGSADAVRRSAADGLARLRQLMKGASR